MQLGDRLSQAFGNTWEWLRRNPLAPVLMVLAIVMRVHASGGLRGLASNVLGNDPGVYFGAAAGLVHGLMPYRDFTLVHPPGSAVFLAPFAWLGEHIGDQHAFATARAAFILLGAINTLLVYLVASRVGRVAAISAAAFYCVLPGPIWVERTTYLEAPMLTATLVALLVYGLKPPVLRRWLIVAGIVFGIAITFKLWAAVPFLVIAIGFGFRHSIRAALIFLASTAATAAVIMLPFFIAAPSQMIHRLIFDQIGRAPVDRGINRLGYMLSVFRFQADAHSKTVGLVLVVVLIAVMLICWLFERRSRLWVALFAVQVVVALSVPVFFGGYRAYYATGLVLVLGVIVQLVWNQSRRWWESQVRVPALVVTVVTGALVLAGLSFVVIKRPLSPGYRANVALISQTVEHARCVTAWNPEWLTASNSLSRSLSNGCDFEADVGGAKFRMNAAQYAQFRVQLFTSGDYTFVPKAEHALPALQSWPIAVKQGPALLLGPKP